MFSVNFDSCKNIFKGNDDILNLKKKIFFLVTLFTFFFKNVFFVPENVVEINKHLLTYAKTNGQDLNIQTLIPPQKWLKTEGIELCKEIFEDRENQARTIRQAFTILEDLPQYNVGYFSTRKLFFFLVSGKATNF